MGTAPNQACKERPVQYNCIAPFLSDLGHAPALPTLVLFISGGAERLPDLQLGIQILCSQG